MMKLFLDDVRKPPEGWAVVRSVNEAKLLLVTEPITHCSLDHDLGAFATYGGDGIALLDFIIEKNLWPSQILNLHTANPVGRDNMLRAIVAAHQRNPHSIPAELIITKLPAHSL